MVISTGCFAFANASAGHNEGSAGGAVTVGPETDADVALPAAVADVEPDPAVVAEPESEPLLHAANARVIAAARATR
ncbi:MAG: hypothetical protein AB7N61_26150, partial [Acidimicrobiia bacterium]